MSEGVRRSVLLLQAPLLSIIALLPMGMGTLLPMGTIGSIFIARVCDSRQRGSTRRYRRPLGTTPFTVAGAPHVSAAARTSCISAYGTVMLTSAYMYGMRSC